MEPHNDIPASTSEVSTDQPLTSTEIVLRKKRPLIAFAIGFGVLLTVCILVLLYLAKGSLPGEPLYRMKTEGSEQVQLLFKRSAQSRATYDTTLLATRLSELQKMTTRGTTATPEELSEIASHSSRHVQDAIAVLEKRDVASEDAIHILASLADLTRTMEVLVDNNESLNTIESTMSDNDSIANKALENNLRAFTDAGPVERVLALIQVEASKLEAMSTTVAEGSTAQITIARRSNDTAEALAESNFHDALQYILKAQQAVVVDQLLWSAERGPVDGAPTVPGEMPEGS